MAALNIRDHRHHQGDSKKTKPNFNHHINQRRDHCLNRSKPIDTISPLIRQSHFTFLSRKTSLLGRKKKSSQVGNNQTGRLSNSNLAEIPLHHSSNIAFSLLPTNLYSVRHNTVAHHVSLVLIVFTLLDWIHLCTCAMFTWYFPVFVFKVHVAIVSGLVYGGGMTVPIIWTLFLMNRPWRRIGGITSTGESYFGEIELTTPVKREERLKALSMLPFLGVVQVLSFVLLPGGRKIQGVHGIVLILTYFGWTNKSSWLQSKLMPWFVVEIGPSYVNKSN